ncbi:FAD-dependent monooxygenase [Actinoplanes sp. NPDC049599]|uniref:FAD-dependent monooxygenase n=1 Tax=Actinoplanes sp. NPDC049599 TaxID=3363903 RepID=UPI0037877F15
MHIAIIGAGISGLTTAVALRRAGLTSQVYEQAPELTEVGAGLQLAPNAVRQLRRLGLGDVLDEVAVRPAAIEMRRWDDGELIMSTALAGCEQRYGAPYLTVHRADLHRCLIGALPSGTVRLDSRLTGLAEWPDRAELTFADGFTTKPEVVVGADGIHSVTRERLVRDRPRFSGQTIYRGLVPADKVPELAEDPKVRLWLGPDQHCVSYPVSGGAWISFGATTPADGWDLESWTAAGQAEHMVRAYRHWHPQVLGLLSAAGTVRRWALHDRDTIERWSTDRLTLAGDAAHPMLPFLAQGANQAVEDAVVLAECLARSTGDVAAALRRYQDIRAPRTAEVQQRSRGNTRTLHLPDGDEQRRRDAELGGRADLSGQDWLWAYDPTTAVAP